MIPNSLKTVILLGTLSGLLLFLGGFLGGSEGLTIALLFSLFMNFIAYFFSEKIVLSMYRAQPLDKTRYNWIYAIVQELTSTMRLPMPKLWLVSTPMANAFATGRNPHHASIAVTTGILDILDRDELRGVLAHELSHIKNRDVLVSTIAATLATAIGYIANMMHHAAFWGSMNSRSNNKKQNYNPIVMLVIALLMPLAAALIRLAISRSREFLADETGAHHSREPLALASALEKLHSNLHHHNLNNQQDSTKTTTASLFIVHPFTHERWSSLFSTHPPVRQRIARLRKMLDPRY